MKIAVKVADLRKGLENIKGKFEGMEVSQIELRGVVKDDIVYIRRGSLGMFQEVKLCGIVFEEGVVCIDFKSIYNVVRGMDKDEEVFVKSVSDKNIEVRYLNTIYVFATDSNGDIEVFEFESGEVEKTFSFPLKVLQTGIKRVISAVSIDILAGVLTCIQVKIKGKEVVMTATDKVELVQCKQFLSSDYEGGDIEFYIHRDIVRQLLKVTDSLHTDVDISIMNKSIVFDIENMRIIVKKKEDKYPSIDIFLNRSVQDLFVIDIKELKEICKEVKGCGRNVVKCRVDKCGVDFVVESGGQMLYERRVGADCNGCVIIESGEEVVCYEEVIYLDFLDLERMLKGMISEKVRVSLDSDKVFVKIAEVSEFFGVDRMLDTVEVIGFLAVYR